MISGKKYVKKYASANMASTAKELRITTLILEISQKRPVREPSIRNVLDLGLRAARPESSHNPLITELEGQEMSPRTAHGQSRLASGLLRIVTVPCCQISDGGDAVATDGAAVGAVSSKPAENGRHNLPHGDR